MEECLAIKPDLVFFWDEAWFAFARCGVIYRQRTGDGGGAGLRQNCAATPTTGSNMPSSCNDFDADGRGALLDMRLLPDPDQVRVRVYVTHSTHKTLTT